MAENKKFVNKLQNYFGLTVSDNTVIPAKETKKGKKPEPIFDNKSQSRLKSLFDYWMNSCHDDLETLRNRLERYKDMERATINNSLIGRAVKIYADETIQSDENKEPLSVEAPKDQKKFIEEFFDETKIFEKLWPTAYNILKYGDAGWLLSVEDGEGVTNIQTISPYDITERLEFTANEVEKELKNKASTISIASSQIERVKQLLDAVTEKGEDYSSYFKSYLFGFVISENIVVPPWRFIHFRNYVDNKPFKPYGMPFFIYSIAPYRQLSAAMGLQVIARGARFPIDQYSLNLPVAMDATEKLERAIEFVQELDNSGLKNNIEKENPGIGERIITIDGLFDFKQITPDIDLGDIDDIEMLRDDVILSTGLPRFLLDPNASSFGTSGAAFAQQYKPFYREIFRLQTILMDNISQVIKIHMISSGKFAEEDIDFTLNMPFPESQSDRDYISSQGDLLRLVNDIIASLGENIIGERGAILPKEVLSDIYLKILPYDDDWVKNLINKTFKDKEKDEIDIAEDPVDPSSDDSDFNYRERSDKMQEARRVIKKLKENQTYDTLLEDTIYETLSKSNRVEFKLGKKHFYSSRAKSDDFDVSNLVEFKKSDVKKLEEALLAE